MKASDLKNSILQLAISGKLVPQDPHDEPANVLFEKIQTERKRLISAGKIKAPKAAKTNGRINPSPPPFEIPESWKWVRLGDVIQLISGQDMVPDKYNNQNQGIPYITGASNIDSDKVVINRWTTEPKSIAEKGDLLITCKGTVGAMAFLQQDKAHIARQVMAIRGNNTQLSLDYVKLYLHTYVQTLQASAKSMIPGIARNDLLSAPFSLPPLTEQRRIIDKLAELEPLITRYGEAAEESARIKTAFPDDLRKAILQYAIEGKLVPQNPVDEPASVLLKKIEAERQRLVREGKIKASKLPKLNEPINPADMPFQIPETWEWVRLGDIGIYKKGPFGSSLTKSIFIEQSSNSVKVYEQKNAIYKDVTLGTYYISREYFDKKMKGFEVFPGEIIVSCAGTIGETFVMPEIMEQGIINQALMKMDMSANIHIPYFLLYFDFILKKASADSSKGSAIKNIPPFEIFKKMLLPLPPIAEQKRIVEKVSELDRLIDKLSELIAQS